MYFVNRVIGSVLFVGYLSSTISSVMKFSVNIKIVFSKKFI